MNFSLAPDIEMIEYGNFCRIGQIDWLSLSQCTFTREKRRWKSHDLQKCNLKIESFLAIFQAYWQITQSGHLFIHWEPFASDLPEKNSHSHNLSMHIHAITKKDNFDQIGAKTSDKHCNLWYDVLVIVSWYSLMVGNIHMWSGQKHRSKVVREEKKLMMIKCDSCYTAIILSSINFQIELSPA